MMLERRYQESDFPEGHVPTIGSVMQMFKTSKEGRMTEILSVAVEYDSLDWIVKYKKKI